MHNGMMDPEMMRLAQEQMSRIPPEELIRLQQQMMSNPELVKLATESMKNLKPGDMRRAAEQLKHARSEDMVEISEKMSKASPEEIAAMKARADAQISYALSAAKMLKQQGNALHSHGQYRDAANKYLLAKKNLKGIPTATCGTLELQCSLNLMSCYLKTRQFEDCIQEGSEVLAYDTKNVKALYRRGQAYKELGMLKAAVSDLNMAHEISPEDETILDVLRDADEKLKEHGEANAPRGLVIEEIVEEETRPVPSDNHGNSSVSLTQPIEVGEFSQSVNNSNSGGRTNNAECLQNLRDDSETIRSFQNYVSNADPDSLAAIGVGGMPPGMVKTATDMISKMKPEEIQKMLQVASSLNGKGSGFPMTTNIDPDRSKLRPEFPEMTPEMVKMASDSLSNMSPEELQKMLEVASSFKMNDAPFPTANMSENSSRASVSDSGESTSGGLFSNSRIGQSSSSLPSSASDLQETMRNSMKDPAMRQMLSSMMKNMNPEMMSNMSEQFGVKLLKEEAAKAQQAMSSLSPDDLDRMLRWAETAQRGVQAMKKTKNWLLGRPGLILAICMLILAVVFRQLGFIG